MEGPRAPFENEFPQVIQFLDTHLRPQTQWSISSEYPLALSEMNRANMRVILENDQVLSHAVMKPLYVKNPVGLLKVATIGSVVTATSRRNQGLSQRVLSDCLAVAQKQACDVAILWTSLHDFYRKLGFELAGSEIAVTFDKAATPPTTPNRYLEGSGISAEALLRLFQSHTVTSLRTTEDVQRSLSIPNSRIFSLWSPENQLLAYAVEGKGADLTAHIHEWGGRVTHLLELVDQIRSRRSTGIALIAPAHSKNLLRQCRERHLPIREGFLGMIKVLNPGSLFSKIKKYARAVGVDGLVLEQREGMFYIGHQDKVFRTDSENDIVRLLFGPAKAASLAAFDPVTTEALEKILPIPFWVWGWDSI